MKSSRMQGPDLIPALKVLVTEAGGDSMGEDRCEGMEYESHYGDMRTDIQEVRLSHLLLEAMLAAALLVTGLRLL